MPRIGSLFSGVGGLDLAVEAFFGAETAWHCEVDPEPSKVLAARWPGVPNLGDITKVDWSSVEPVDILCGGFPCQDLSLAGRRKGIRPGTRSGLWADFRNAIEALRPSVVIIENVRGLLSGCAESDSDVEPCPGCVGDGQHRPLVRALGRVLGDLAGLGFDAEWGSLPASAVGAPHGRFRVFVVAYARGVRLGAGWNAAPGQASGGGAPAVVSGRGGAPVALLPTPSASNANDGEQLDTWFERRERVKQTANNGNGMGMPLAIAALTLLPTPQVADAEGGHARRGGKRGDELLLPGIAESLSLLPTPRASRGASSTETMYALGAERTDDGDAQGNVTFTEGGNHAAPKESGPGEVLPSLWDEVGTETIRRPIRGSDAVSVSPDLFAGVREHEGASTGGNAPLASPEVPRVSMRGVLHDDGATGCAPHRPEPSEQRTIEPSDALRELSPEEALAGRPELRETRIEWGAYEAAVHRWEAVLGRPAPSPTRPDGKNGNHRLNPEFCSWMMGYPAGHVTDVLTRNPAIKACGNGVVPQQAYAALDGLWSRVLESIAA